MRAPPQSLKQSAPGAAPDDGGNVLSAFARDRAARLSVMSSLRGLGAGISKLFTAASVTGSRGASVTPPPSEMHTLATNSMTVPGPPPPHGHAWAPFAGGSGGGGGGAQAPGFGGSSGGASSAGVSVPPSPNSVLGVSPSALAARMRLLRSPVPLPLQPQAPLTAPPPSQDMLAVSSGGGGGGGSGSGSSADAAPALLSPSASGGAPAPPPGASPLAPPAPGGTPQQHHHYRVAHMRTITEENLDTLLRHGSSGGVTDLLGVSPVPGTPRGGAEGAAPEASLANGGGVGERSQCAARKRAELLGSHAEGEEGEEPVATSAAALAPALLPAPGQPQPVAPALPSAPPAQRSSDSSGGSGSACGGSGGGGGGGGSPFANSGALAGRIVLSGGGPLAMEADGAAVVRTSAGGALLGGGLAPTRASSGGRSATPQQAPAWAGASGAAAAAALAPGPAGGAQVGAGDLLAVPTRYAPPAAPDDVRLVMRSPRRVSSAGASDGGGWAPAAAGGRHPDAARRVAYHWWKPLPEASLQQAASMSASDLDGYDAWREKPILAKPSVRFRKTINADNPNYKPYGARCAAAARRAAPPRGLRGAALCVPAACRSRPAARALPCAPRRRNPSERPKVAVNAQHYAILVTDVTQWPYPELQRCDARGGRLRLARRRQAAAFSAWRAPGAER